MPQSLESLVERQIRRSDLVRRAAPGPVAPCIALSRLPGSGAAELGQRLAARIGYEFFGIELVDRIARTAQVRRRLVEALDERVRPLLDRYAADHFRKSGFLEIDYVRHLIEVIGSLGEYGGAVILGRGAPYILRPERTLRVLVTAPRADRVARLARARGLSPEEASLRLAREDAERDEFVRHHFQVDPDDTSLYDVALNTGTLGVAGALEILLRVFELRFGKLPAAAAQV